ncbi:tRNA (guanine37-N1)-methyltransferase [Kwoniella heveanensis CBS 569]|nr:tRNA (guanine37-N1)-methyltransferase [Kwoniella heveanensis CBS 569]
MSATSYSASHIPHGALKEYMKPPQLIGMQTLDRKAFDVSVPILSAAVEASKIGKLRPHPALKNYTLDLPKIKMIVDSPEGDKGIKYFRLHVSEENQLPEETRGEIAAETKGLRRETVHLGYDNWNTSEILAAVLPTTESDNIPSSFTSTGHIAHMNLREEWLPYRHLIGEVILDKNPGLRTVVNKLDTIHAQYRYFDMEVIAGDKDYITTLNESSCSFTFDFSRVYWNSRLHHEHERLISLFPPNSLVADVMAGVGPFAVPAAKRGSYVLGNDLNPESVKWMRENRVKNHVENNLRVFEQDGAAFIQSAALEAWRNPFKASAGPSKTEQRKQAKEARRERERRAKAAGTMSENPQAEGSTTAASKLLQTTVDAISNVTASLSLAASNLAGSATMSTSSATESGTSANTDSTTSQPSAIAVAAASASASSSAFAPSPVPDPPRIIQHFIMNLPDSALTFLGAYRGCFTRLLIDDDFVNQYGADIATSTSDGSAVTEPGRKNRLEMPLVHVYCFTREVEREKAEPDILARATQYLEYTLTPQSEGYNLHLVRSVAPNKDMYCLTFRLPKQVAFAPLPSSNC